jgi:CheY-like chemotaxis protein
VVIEVADTGEGIAPEVLEHAFEPFFTTKAVGHGTGLGLSQVYGFCLRAGGRARIDSIPGSGTRVRLCLPAALRDTVSEPPPVDNRPNAFEWRVLVVDDNDALAQSVKEMLESTGCNVTVAGDAEQALTFLSVDSRFDVVLSDLVMPGPLDGLGLAKTLRREFPALPVVLMTGYSDEAANARARAFQVLPKPCPAPALIHALSDAIQNPRAQG